MLQVFRNVSLVAYLGLLTIAYGFLYISLILENKNLFEYPSSVFRLLKLVFLMTIVWLPVISLLNMSTSEYFNSFSRYLVTVPYILFCYLYKGYDKPFIKRVVRLFVFFVALAALSIPLQMVIGPLSFLEEGYLRGGFMRYASIAGSLNALGTLSGFSISLLLIGNDDYFRKNERSILLIATIVGSLLSLQKAAVINILISFALFLIIKGDKRFKKPLFVITLLVVGCISYFAMQDLQFINVAITSVEYTLVSNNELDFMTDLLQRFWYLPSRVVTHHDFVGSDWIFGIGFSALSGILGNPNLPMSHNNYFDLIFSGGIFHLSSFLLLLLRIPYRTIKRKLRHEKTSHMEMSYVCLVVLILANMLIGAATMYQPVNAVIIYFCIFSFDYIGSKSCT